MFFFRSCYRCGSRSCAFLVIVPVITLVLVPVLFLLLVLFHVLGIFIAPDLVLVLVFVLLFFPYAGKLNRHC